MYSKTCANCGKEFIFLGWGRYFYTLKINRRKRHYCSYECWNHAKKQLQTKQEDNTND